MNWQQQRDFLRQKMWNLLCNRSEDYVPSDKALAFLCACDPRNAEVVNLLPLANLMNTDLKLVARELDGVSTFPEVHKHYRAVDGACSVELMWHYARRLGLAHALDLITEAETYRRDRGLSFFIGATDGKGADAIDNDVVSSASVSTPNVDTVAEPKKKVKRDAILAAARETGEQLIRMFDEMAAKKGSENGVIAEMARLLHEDPSNLRRKIESARNRRGEPASSPGAVLSPVSWIHPISPEVATRKPSRER